MKHRGHHLPRARGLAIAFALLVPSLGCALLHPPLAGAVVYPFVEPSSDSISAESPRKVAKGYEDSLAEVRLGVLRNLYRDGWDSTVGGQNVDERRDENELLWEYMQDTDLFGEVAILSRPTERPDLDYYVVCSVDCIYEVDLDGWMYAFNIVTLGLGFLLAYPYQDSSAFYLAEAVFYEYRDGRLQAVGGSLVCNQKEWYGDGLYWRPGFYGKRSLKPLFRQMTSDFLRETGVLDR